MHQLYQLLKFELFVMYLCGYVFYMLVNAGLASAASHLLKEPQLRNRPRLEFGLCAIGAFAAVVAPPLVMVAVMHVQPSISVPVVVALFAIYMDYRNLQESHLDPLELWGDLTGFALGLGILGAWAAFGARLGWPPFRL